MKITQHDPTDPVPDSWWFVCDRCGKQVTMNDDEVMIPIEIQWQVGGRKNHDICNKCYKELEYWWKHSQK